MIWVVVVCIWLKNHVLASDDIMVTAPGTYVEWPKYEPEKFKGSVCDYYPDICGATEQGIAKYERSLAEKEEIDPQKLMKEVMQLAEDDTDDIGFKFTCKQFSGY